MKALCFHTLKTDYIQGGQNSEVGSAASFEIHKCNSDYVKSLGPRECASDQEIEKFLRTAVIKVLRISDSVDLGIKGKVPSYTDEETLYDGVV